MSGNRDIRSTRLVDLLARRFAVATDLGTGQAVVTTETPNR